MKSTLAAAAATWAIAMALSPLLQSRKIMQFRSSHGVSIAYVRVLLVGFILWVAYGIAAANMALVVPNTVAAVITVATIATALRYRVSTSWGADR
jgi:uncharacterized protein with PQ loop repeat